MGGNGVSFHLLYWCPAAQLASIRLMSRQVSRGSAREYQADEQEAGVARLRWRVSGTLQMETRLEGTGKNDKELYDLEV